MHQTYTNAEPLECCSFSRLKREIGVSVYAYKGGNMLDLACERVDLTVNTSSSGRGLRPGDDVQAAVITATAQIIEHLNTVITELTAHRDRLAEELVRVELEGLGGGQSE